MYHFAAIGVFKLELQSGNGQFGSKSTILWAAWPCNLTYDLENYRAPLLFYFKLCALFRSHWWIQTWVTLRKCPIWVKFDVFIEPCDLEIWQMTLKNNRAPLLCYFKRCASFHSHRWFQIGDTVRKRPIWVKINDFFQLCDLAIWCMTLKNNRTAFLPYFKLCVSFRSHWCIQTWVTVRKRPIWVKTDDFLVVWPCNLTYDLEKQ